MAQWSYRSLNSTPCRVVLSATMRSFLLRRVSTVVSDSVHGRGGSLATRAALARRCALATRSGAGEGKISPGKDSAIHAWSSELATESEETVRTAAIDAPTVALIYGE